MMTAAGSCGRAMNAVAVFLTIYMLGERIVEVDFSTGSMVSVALG